MPYKNKKDFNENNLRYRKANQKRMIDYLSDKECLDCGENNIVCLEFDHVRGVKSFNVGQAVSSSTRSWELILKEIDKCEIRCANCHRIKTQTVLNSYKINIPN